MIIPVFLLPSHSFAAVEQVNILEGKLFSSVNGKISGLANITDDDLVSQAFWSGDDTAYYEFPTPINIARGSYITGTASFKMDIRLLDPEGVVLYTRSVTAGTFQLPVLQNVSRIEAIGTHSNTYGGSTLKDFKIYTNPPNPELEKFVITDLRYQMTSGTSLNLSWSPVESDYLDSYKVYQNTELIGTVTTNSFSVSGLQHSTSYSFKVAPVDTDFTEFTGQTITVNVPEPDTTAPGEPTQVNVTPDRYSATVTWNAPSDTDISGYNVYLDGNAVNGSLIRGRQTTLTGLSHSTSYEVSVEAVDTSGNKSGKTTPVSFTTLELLKAPNSPRILGTAFTGGASITWAPVPSAESYKVYQDGTLILTTDTTGVKLKDLENERPYSYYVIATNEVGDSEPSNTLTITPSIKAVPDVGLNYGLKDVAEGTSSWFNSYWLILAFTIAIPLSFYVSNRVKGLFT